MERNVLGWLSRYYRLGGKPGWTRRLLLEEGKQKRDHLVSLDSVNLDFPVIEDLTVRRRPLELSG
jgi:hypothetical protein